MSKDRVITALEKYNDKLQAENEQLTDLLRYFYELPSKGVRNQEVHNKKLEEVEQVLKGGGLTAKDARPESD